MSKWIVAGNVMFYPWIEEYDSYEEAKADYDRTKGNSKHIIYLAEIKDQKEE